MAHTPLHPGLKRVLNARPDTLDFRDKMYEATLVEVPTSMPLEDYQAWGVPILDQGQEGACTGFGLATVANYLLRRRKYVPDTTPVSPRMFYVMARRYDEWPGENYDGSSARGAMKGWNKHGICASEAWPYVVGQEDRTLTDARAKDATRRPLGAYYRVNHKDMVCMHSAIAEVGVLYVTCNVQAGWQAIGADGVIPLQTEIIGGHAFAIVGYDERGFWLQNSWGPNWGKGGFALITYDDWLQNGTDVWVARLGAPVDLQTTSGSASLRAGAASRSSALSASDLRPHIISTGYNGQLEPGGTYGSHEEDVKTILNDDFPETTKDWPVKRLLLYAHGGLVPESSAVQTVADYRGPLLDAQVYPLAFLWHSDYLTTLCNILEDALSRRRPEGFLDAAKDFMLDRLDDALEPLARALTGKAEWDEMKKNALMATTDPTGGARISLNYLIPLAQNDPKIEIHVAGHSAGAIFCAPLIQRLTEAGVKVKTCTMWAPACTVALFKQYYLPAIQSGGVGHFGLFTLDDKTEQDDNCADIYHKSLLYLVSNALEEWPHVPLLQDGVPILGMEKFIRNDPDIQALLHDMKADWVRSPNQAALGSPGAAHARHHGDFHSDGPTVRATLARILGTTTETAHLRLTRSSSELRRRRLALQ